MSPAATQTFANQRATTTTTRIRWQKHKLRAKAFTQECAAAAVHNAYIERKALSGLSVGWNQLTFTLPTNVVAALKGQNNGCKFWMDHQGIGKFHYDNLGFLQVSLRQSLVLLTIAPHWAIEKNPRNVSFPTKFALRETSCKRSS